MTIAVDLGRKATKQTKNEFYRSKNMISRVCDLVRYPQLQKPSPLKPLIRIQKSLAEIETG